MDLSLPAFPLHQGITDLGTATQDNTNPEIINQTARLCPHVHYGGESFLFPFERTQERATSAVGSMSPSALFILLFPRFTCIAHAAMPCPCSSPF